MIRVSAVIGLLFVVGTAGADDLSTSQAGAGGSSPLAAALLFHASFDRSADADVAKGDARIYTAASLQRDKIQPGLHSDAVVLATRAGRYGGALMFSKKSDQVVFFQGAQNLPATTGKFAGTISFWLRLSPSEDLPPGYVDPLQVTDKKWNDASFFVDFTKELPRQFRLGVFSDYPFWNPQDRPWDNIPAAERPLVTVAKPPFTRERWTHVGITFRDFNDRANAGAATLFLDGESQGELSGQQQFTWKPEKLAIMLGIYYVGGLDDLAIFDRALSSAEMMQVFALPDGIKSLGVHNKP